MTHAEQLTVSLATPGRSDDTSRSAEVDQAASQRKVNLVVAAILALATPYIKRLAPQTK